MSCGGGAGPFWWLELLIPLVTRVWKDEEFSVRKKKKKGNSNLFPFEIEHNLNQYTLRWFLLRQVNRDKKPPRSSLGCWPWGKEKSGLVTWTQWHHGRKEFPKQCWLLTPICLIWGVCWQWDLGNLGWSRCGASWVEISLESWILLPWRSAVLKPTTAPMIFLNQTRWILNCSSRGPHCLARQLILEQLCSGHGGGFLSPKGICLSFASCDWMGVALETLISTWRFGQCWEVGRKLHVGYA